MNKGSKLREMRDWFLEPWGTEKVEPKLTSFYPQIGEEMSRIKIASTAFTDLFKEIHKWQKPFYDKIR